MRDYKSAGTGTRSTLAGSRTAGGRPWLLVVLGVAILLMGVAAALALRDTGSEPTATTLKGSPGRDVIPLRLPPAN